MLKISIILTIKNGENYINYLNHYFDKVENLYLNKYKLEYFIYENNSTDNTKKAIENFYKYKNRAGKYFLENIHNSKNLNGITRERGEYMSFLRNKLKTYHGVLDSEYTLLIDCDVVFTYDIIEKLLNNFNSYRFLVGSSNTNTKSIELPTASISASPIPLNKQDSSWNDKFKIHVNNKTLTVTRIDSNGGWGQELELLIKPSNSIVAITPYDICYNESVKENNKIINNHYYDSLALITNKNISYKDNDNKCMFDNCRRCINHRKNHKIIIDDSLLLKHNNINSVKSAFGGCFLIKTSVYNKIKWEASICEHHSFCEKARQFGDILLEPRLKVITNPCNNFLNYIKTQNLLN
jgi:hypothetical protein